METEVKKSKFNVGYFFLAIVPAITSIVMQVGALMALLIVALAVYVATGAVNVGDSETYMKFIMELTQKMSIPAILVYHVFGIIVFGLWYKLTFRKPRPTVKDSFKNVNVLVFVLSLVAGGFMSLCANGIVVIEAVALPNQMEAYLKLAESAGMGEDVLTIIATICLAPIGEELLCRGVILAYAKKAFGNFWMANVLQALMFALIHMNWIQGIYAFLLGLAAGWLVEKRKSIIPGMLIHFGMNFSSSTWIGVVLTKIFGEEMPDNILVGIAMCVVFGAAMLGIFALMEKKAPVKEA